MLWSAFQLAIFHAIFGPKAGHRSIRKFSSADHSKKSALVNLRLRYGTTRRFFHCSATQASFAWIRIGRSIQNRPDTLAQIGRRAPAEIVAGVAPERRVNVELVTHGKTGAGEEKPMAIRRQFRSELTGERIDGWPEIL